MDYGHEYLFMKAPSCMFIADINPSFKYKTQIDSNFRRNPSVRFSQVESNRQEGGPDFRLKHLNIGWLKQ